MKKYNKFDQVIILVNSLSKSEKRYFRLYTQIQRGNKNYLLLFDLIERHCSLDEISEIFKRRGVQQKPAIVAKYLYEIILESLLSLREKYDMKYQVMQSVIKAGILFERGLHYPSFYELDKAKGIAQMYELDILNLLIDRLKLKLSRTLDFINVADERSLVNEYFQINETLKSCRNTNIHLQLYDVLRYRTIFTDKMPAESLEDLVLGELYLMSRHVHKKTETKKLHMLFQATYYLYIGKSKLAVKYFKELIALFESNKALIMNPPIYYSMAVKGIIKSLIAENLYNDAFFFIDKLENIVSEKFPAEFNIETTSITYKYRMISLLKLGKIAEASSLSEDAVIPFCKNNVQHLKQHNLLDLYLCIAVLFVSTHKYREAKGYANKILNTGKIYDNYMMPRIARLINIVASIELDDHNTVCMKLVMPDDTIPHVTRPRSCCSIMWRFIFRYLPGLKNKSCLIRWQRMLLG